MLNVGDDAREKDVQALEAVLEKMLPEHQTIIRFRHQEKFTFAQIGEAMDCSADEAKRLWSRAIEELSKKL